MLSFLNLPSLLSRRRRRRRAQQAPVQHEDVFQINEALHSSCSDLGDGVPEVTDSQPEPAMAQVSPQRNEPLSYSSSELVEEAEEATESEAARSLASRIPPELFENMLFYVNVDRVSQRMYKDGSSLIRNRGEPSKGDILADLKQCSLVCLFWANRCRQHMFWDRTLLITSYEDAEIFRRYVIGGCPRLTPIHQLIEKIIVAQDYKSRRSFLHLVYLPAIQDKLKQLFIEGPVPDGFNPAKLDTPHWGIPPCIVVPSSFLQNTTISLDDVHLPSFHHVAKYMRHLTCATYIEFEKITWDGQTPTYSLPHASNTIAYQCRPHSLSIRAVGVCTDSVTLALTALMLNPNCPLHRLSDEERVWMIKFMTLLWGDKPDPDVRIGFNVSEQTTTMDLWPFGFVFEQAPATDRSASALSVVGMDAYIRDPNDFPTNFDALVNHARTHPIRALVLLFRSINNLQQSIKPFFEVLTLATETIELVLAYEKEKERKAVGVDLVTLEPNDCLWEDLRGRYIEDRSLEILQRQLKKKRWMSLH